MGELWTYRQETQIYVLACYAKSLQSCPTLCVPMDSSLPGSSVHEILQARKLDCVAIFFFRVSYWPRDWTHVSFEDLPCIGYENLC